MIELMQALLIFSFVTTIVFGLFVQIKRTIELREAQHALQEQAGKGLQGISGMIAGAAGWVSGDSVSLTLLDREDRTRTIRWSDRDSQVSVDGKPLFAKPLRVPVFSMRYLPRADSAAMIREEDLFLSLDTDRNGILEGAELVGARMVEIRLLAVARQRRIELRSMVTLPRPVPDTAAFR